MPEWVWIALVVVVLVDKFRRVTVIDLLRGLIHLEFVETDEPAVEAKPTRQRKQIAK